MELWIRSQNKRHFLKVDIINWFGGEFYTPNKVDLETEKDGKIYLLGRYCNGKRALEVLDEIYTILHSVYSPDLLSEVSDISKQVYIPPIITYQMPKE